MQGTDDHGGGSKDAGRAGGAAWPATQSLPRARTLLLPRAAWGIARGTFNLPTTKVRASRLCARRPPPRIALISTSMSNLSQKDPPELSEATTGRSKCQRCREPILKGEQRVGMLTRTSRSLRTCGLRHQPPAYRTYLWRWAAAGAPRTYAVRVPASLGVPHIPRTVAPQAGGHGRPIVGHLRAQMGC